LVLLDGKPIGWKGIKMKITSEMIEAWLGGNPTRDELLELVAELANNDYPQSILYADICSYIKEE
jgi:hypothetical protein